MRKFIIIILAVLVICGAAYQTVQAQNVLIITSDGRESEASGLQSVLTNMGRTVTVLPGASFPADISGFDVFYSIDIRNDTSPANHTQIVNFINSGKGAYLGGETASSSRNIPMLSVANQVINNGPIDVDVSFNRRADSAPVNPSAPGPIASDPNDLSATPLYLAGAGSFIGVTGNNILAVDAQGDIGGGIWDSSDLVSGVGRLVTIADLNWVLSVINNSLFMENLQVYLEGSGSPSLEATKTFTLDITAGFDVLGLDAGDMVNFTIAIENTGTTTLTSVGVASDTLLRPDATPLSLTSGPTFVSNSGGSPAGTLAPGEVATFAASYTLVQADFDAGGVTNTSTVSGAPPSGPAVTDVSDDGDDTDGNMEDDVTVLTIAPIPSLTITKTASAPGFTTGDVQQAPVGTIITYMYVVTNTGNQTISNITLAESHGGSGAPPIPGNETLSTDNSPIGNSNDTVNDGIWDSLAPNDQVTFLSTYIVTQTDVDTLQ